MRNWIFIGRKIVFGERMNKICVRILRNWEKKETKKNIRRNKFWKKTKEDLKNWESIKLIK